MGRTWGSMMLALALLLLIVGAQAQTINYRPYLQAELNEIAMLTAQANYLQQQGDLLTSTLISSYIPDHQMMADMWANLIRRQGGNPASTQASVTPFLGTRAQILAHDLQAHQQAATMYSELADRARLINRGVRDLARLGQSGASRHFASLTVAQGATLGGPQAVQNAIASALSLERMMIIDLQTQAARLRELGDAQTANTLDALVPAHQQQISRLEPLLTQLGGNPSAVYVPPVLPLDSRDAILAHVRASDIQMANTYGQIVALLPPSPIQQAGVFGQRNALTAIARLFGGPLPA